ncbi:MAG: patatin-like phospholipase RssA [Gammaproteobacteria bacterium]|nr:patatin-like phospholipase RssA [Gammaproteobacteria bacterium]
MSPIRNHKPQIGIALGSGAARGWSHIGVLNALEQRGISPDIIAGTSIGSLVGAAYADDKLSELEAWVEDLKWHDVISYFDISLDGGFIAGKKLFQFLRDNFYNKDIAELKKPFGAVATNMDSGIEVWLRQGPVMDAARASSSIPGFFTPVAHDKGWLVDGGLVNPIPVSLCRAMGADIVIAVDLNASPMWNGESDWQTPANPQPTQSTSENAFVNQLTKLKNKIWPSDIGKSLLEKRDDVPSILEVLSRSLNIMQLRISRSRMAGDPPDILIRPSLPDIDMLDFHRAAECIREGEEAVKRMESQLHYYRLIKE